MAEGLDFCLCECVSILSLDNTRYSDYSFTMKLTLQIQLLPDTGTAQKLKATIERFNEATNWLAQKAFERKLSNKFALQKLYYSKLRNLFGLSAQMAIRCIAQAVEAYKRDQSVQPSFRPTAAVPYDQRLYSFKGIDRVSLLTLEGRVLVPMIMGDYQREQFGYAKGQADLVLRKDGKWFLLVCVDIPDGTLIPVTDFIGVDLGTANLAVTDDGETFSGNTVENIRQKMSNLRKSLQQKASKLVRQGKRPKNVRRKLSAISGRESRFRRNTNHIISKRIVEKAKDTGKAIALENLDGIRKSQKRFRKPQRAKLSGWSFFQLRTFIEYKAKRAGIRIEPVDPKYTSQTCAECGHCEKDNRHTQASFLCKVCGHKDHADRNAARNIRVKALCQQA
ncbi:MAG: IS200/IS605 family element transposase accessory protein TnpB [Gemmatimonadetes bacterium]|nr:IS200/IS605 family element transposase accessory protein TnpB [Gemmatimonadota bacterium]